MGQYCELFTAVWEDLLDFSPSQRLLYLYLFSNPACRPSGLYKIKLKTIKHFTDATEGDVKALCHKIIEYDFGTQEVWVRGKLRRFAANAKKNWMIQKAISNDLDDLDSPVLKRLFIKKYKGYLKGIGKGITRPPSVYDSDYDSDLFDNKLTSSKKEKAGKPKPEVHQFMSWWHDEYQKRFKRKYVFHGDKEAAIAKRLISVLGLQAVIECGDRFFETMDDFVQKSGHTIGVFAVRINQLARGEIYQRLTPVQIKNLKKLKEVRYES